MNVIKGFFNSTLKCLLKDKNKILDFGRGYDGISIMECETAFNKKIQEFEFLLKCSGLEVGFVGIVGGGYIFEDGKYVNDEYFHFFLVDKAHFEQHKAEIYLEQIKIYEENGVTLPLWLAVEKGKYIEY